jgi:Tol biopolymer transport system component
MKRMLVIAMVALTAIVSAQVNPEVAFRAAMETETVKGDLRAAIEQYKVVVESGNRSLAARALVRMAECHQKLGTDEARSIYQQVVRDYQDQPDALATARVRLVEAPATASARGDRVLWTGRDVDLFGTVSPDGRYLSYTDWFTTNNLMLHDFENGSDRALTHNTTYGQFGYTGWSAISRTGREVAYEWDDHRTNRTELRVASLRSTVVPPSYRVVLDLDRYDSIRPFDWSPDERWLAVLVERQDRSSQIGLVSLQDGTLQVLKSINWRGVGKMVFSPDGRHLAYDIEEGDERHQVIRVMAADASYETVVVTGGAHNHVMGWAADGYLLFGSDRSGTLGLWGQRIAEGKASGTPVLLRRDLTSSWSLGLTAAGTLHVWGPAGAQYVRVTRFDGESGVSPSDSTFEHFIESRGRPDWSGDGKHLAFISCGPAGGGPCQLKIWSSETNTVRSVSHGLQYMAFPALSYDGRQIVTDGTDRRGRQGVFLIDTIAGSTRFVTGAAGPGNSEWAADGRSVYRPGPKRTLLQRDLTTGNERQVFAPTGPDVRQCRVAPNGELVACVSGNPTDRSSALVVSPIANAEPRTVLQVSAPDEIFFRFEWAGDSRSLLAVAGNQWWLVPLAGEPRKVELQGELAQPSPDGRHVAYVANAGADGGQVWALENILPASKASR